MAPPVWVTTPLFVLTATAAPTEVDNLFVVDGSPFPTATGANPTLTIMANAWRVSDHICRSEPASRGREDSNRAGR